MSAPSETQDRPTPADPTDAWANYLQAAQRLDLVRRKAASAAAEQLRATRSAHELLIDVQARLTSQRSRLRAFGVPASALQPSAPDVTVAATALAGDPKAALAVLDRARSATEAADVTVAELARSGWSGPWPPWLPNALIYGTLALAILLAVACVGIGTLWLNR